MVLCLQDGVHPLAAASNLPCKLRDTMHSETQAINVLFLGRTNNLHCCVEACHVKLVRLARFGANRHGDS